MYLIIALICISLKSGDVGHLFTCLLTIWISSLEKRLFQSFAHVLTVFIIIIIIIESKSLDF